MSESPITPTEEELSQWNMAKLFMWELHQLIERKDTAAIDDDLIGWQRGLSAILRKVSWKLKKSEYESLQERLSRLREELQSIQAAQQRPQYASMLLRKVTKELDDIDADLQIVMNKYRLFFPEAKIRGIEGLRRRMKLPDS